jgi:hypothetical protein
MSMEGHGREIWWPDLQMSSSLLLTFHWTYWTCEYSKTVGKYSLVGVPEEERIGFINKQNLNDNYNYTNYTNDI